MIGSVPVQPPLAAVSVAPSSTAPLTVGGDADSGGRTSTPPPEGAEVAWALPATLVAVTETRTSWPMSSGVSV